MSVADTGWKAELWSGESPESSVRSPRSGNTNPEPLVLLMDRENLLARGWSHVVSDRDDLAELEELRVRVGAPPRALQFGAGHRPHLDLMLEPRDRALVDPAVRVFERTRDLLAWLHTHSTRDAPQT